MLQLSAFSPLPSTPPPSLTSTLPLDFVLVSFIVAPIDPSPHYPLSNPLWLLLQCLRIISILDTLSVMLLFTSGSQILISHHKDFINNKWVNSNKDWQNKTSNLVAMLFCRSVLCNGTFCNDGNASICFILGTGLMWLLRSWNMASKSEELNCN